MVHRGGEREIAVGRGGGPWRSSTVARAEVEPGDAHVAALRGAAVVDHDGVAVALGVLLDHDGVGAGGHRRAGEDAHGFAGADRAGERTAGRDLADDA